MQARPRCTGSLSLPQVCGSLGAGPPQLLPPPVHTVYLAGWLPPHPAGVTGTSEEPLWPPRFGIAVFLAGDRQRMGAAGGPRRLRGGQEWQCSLVGAGGTRRGLPEEAAAWGPPGKGHLQRTVLPTTQKGERVWLGTGKKTPQRSKNMGLSATFRSDSGHVPHLRHQPSWLSREGEAAPKHPLRRPESPSPTRPLYGQKFTS